MAVIFQYEAVCDKQDRRAYIVTIAVPAVRPCGTGLSVGTVAVSDPLTQRV